MGKKKDPFPTQMKTVDDIEERIAALIEEYGSLMESYGKGEAKGVAIRTMLGSSSATLFAEGYQGVSRNRDEQGKRLPYKLYDGVRECDFKFKDGNPDYIEASRKHGLSFSVAVDHAVDLVKFFGQVSKKGTKIQSAYWILKDSDQIPDGLEFVEDPKDPRHFLLAVTQPDGMHLKDLVAKLKWIGDRMAVMNDLALEAKK